jgi:hypothetical protein
LVLAQLLGGNIIAALITEYTIIHLGRETDPDGTRKRSPLTHSIITAPLWGIVIGLGLGTIFLPIFFLISNSIGSGLPLCGNTPNTICQLLGRLSVVVFVALVGSASSVWGGLIASSTHLLLDSLTDGGVFVPENRKHIPWRQILSTMASAISSAVILPRLVRLKPPTKTETPEGEEEVHGFEYEEMNLLPEDKPTGFENFKQVKLAGITVPKPSLTLHQSLNPEPLTLDTSTVPAKRFCRNCGERLRPGATFCHSCGGKTP